jgi:thiol-disulfide isomerase/thioredoxin
MKKLLLAFAVLMSFVGSANAEFYGTDYNKAIATSKAKDEPLVLMITASWCSPCQAQKKIIEGMVKDGTLPKGVHVAYVKYDSELAKKIRVSKSVPQLIRYRKVDGVWKKAVHIGYLKTPKLMEFLNG